MDERIVWSITIYKGDELEGYYITKAGDVFVVHLHCRDFDRLDALRHQAEEEIRRKAT